jgi:hypothetical protein
MEVIMPALVTKSEVRILTAENPRVPGPGESTRG